MKKKKLLSLLLAAVLAIGVLAACGPQESTDTDVEGTVSTTDNTSAAEENGSSEQENLSLPFVRDDAPEVEIRNINCDINAILEDKNNLLDVHLRGNRFPVDFVPLLLEDNGLLPFSASSAEDAKTKTLSHYTSLKECVLLFETEYCYGFYLRPEEGLTKQAICFKSDVITFDSEGNYAIITDEPGVVRRIMDFMYYVNNRLGGSQVVQTELVQEDDVFTYTAYYVETTYGDWDVPNFVYFYKQVTEIPTDGTQVSVGEKTLLQTVQYNDVYPIASEN